MIEIPVSWGELIDKITILEIKCERIGDPLKHGNVRRELELLLPKLAAAPGHAELARLRAALKTVNLTLWDVEDEIRECERSGDFGPRFIALARQVYRENDVRASLKRQINLVLDSSIIEEKSYKSY